MKISVTSTHITNGKRQSKFCCPIALALNEARGVRHIVMSGCVYEDQPIGWSGAWGLPMEAITFVSRFDAGQPVEPFEFELSIP